MDSNSMRKPACEPVDLTVIVVTFQSEGSISRCLESLGNGVSEILVVDNHSQDKTAEIVNQWVAEHPLARVRLIQNNENLGYGRAANVGRRESRTRYSLLLNADICMTPAQIQELWQHAHLAPIVAPDVVTDSGKSEQKYLDGASRQSGNPCFVPWVVGAAMLIDNESTPEFDDNIFLFFEETDLCRRVEKIAVIPGVKVRHRSGTSSGTNDAVLYLKGWHCAWSRHYYRRKHQLRHSVTGYLLVKCLQWTLNIGNPQKRVKYGSRIAGTFAWLRGKSALTFTVPQDRSESDVCREIPTARKSAA